MKRIIRDRRLTPEEIEKDRRVRELIEMEKPEISAAIRERMAEIEPQGIHTRDHVRQVFHAIMSAWVDHLSEIEQLVLRIETEKEKYQRRERGRRTWSFEETHLNPWARSACKSPGRGSGLRYSNGREMDLLVSAPGFEPVPVEVALVTNVTEEKWTGKINADRCKLKTLAEWPGLQIVACFDTYDLEHCQSWLPFLGRIEEWDQPTYVFRRKILNDGLMLVKGWRVEPTRPWRHMATQ